MERKLRETEYYPIERNWNSGSDPETHAARRRLERLTKLNAEIESRSGSTDPRRSGVAVKGVGFEMAYAFLGALLGLVPPGSFFLRVILDETTSDIYPLALLGTLVMFISAFVGFFSGKVVGRIVRELHAFRWPAMLATLPFVGITWGILAGGAGGAIIFLIGAIPGAVMGAAVGSAALTAFGAIHRLLKKDDEIEQGHLIPLALGVSAVIAAAFLGATA